MSEVAVAKQNIDERLENGKPLIIPPSQTR